MILLTLLFLFLLVLGFYWPRFLVFFITVPLVGTALGGLAWGVVCMITKGGGLVTLPAFGGFVLGGNLVALAGGIALDGCD